MYRSVFCKLGHRKWKRFSRFFSSKGLLGIPELQAPSDFLSMAASSMNVCNDLRSLLSTTSTNDSQNPRETLYQLDEISKQVCNVIDAAELVRSVHTDAKWREAAHKAFSLLADYIAELNSDPILYESLMNAEKQAKDGVFTEEERRFVLLLRAEFERDGIHLPEAQRQELRSIQNSITELESLFQNNLMSSRRSFLADARAVTDVLPLQILQAYGMDKINDDGQIELVNDQAILQSLLKYSGDAGLRKQVFYEANTSVPENLKVLDALRERRHQLATALGFASYAERFLRDKMAQTPVNVKKFLHTLQVRTQPIFKNEMELLAVAKQHVEGGAIIEPWDISFYVSVLKARDGFDINAVSEYLSLDNCIEGMQALVESLFGISMREQAVSKEETWDDSVRRFDFEFQGTSLGTMYLDLHPRPDKYGHAAHFTVRCGCVKNYLMSDEEYQLPIIVLVCNISSSPSRMLAHAEVETLFHEFGHALHSLLSRTKFQHMSGTRAAMDFVETPSHLVENFAWDGEFLEMWARSENGQVIPKDMIRNLQQSRNEFHAIEKQNQIMYALFDQLLFGAPEDSGGMSTTELFARLHLDHGVPYASGTHWHSRFGHLVTYGAGYYGYLYSQVFAGDIWASCFEGNSLSREAGMDLWKKLLIHGGARDPELMLTDLLGRPPKIDFYSTL